MILINQVKMKQRVMELKGMFLPRKYSEAMNMKVASKVKEKSHLF